jgi:hypothetical protein
MQSIEVAILTLTVRSQLNYLTAIDERKTGLRLNEDPQGMIRARRSGIGMR